MSDMMLDESNHTQFAQLMVCQLKRDPRLWQHIEFSHKHVKFTITENKNQRYRVKVFPRPLSSIHLILKFLCHDPLSVLIIQMC